MTMDMLKIVLSIGFLLVSYSSTPQKKIGDCHENLKFKRKFFYNITVVESYTIESRTPTKKLTISDKSFFKAIDFISKYSKVPVGNIYNYQIGYKSIEEFEVEKKKWLNWYDANKCNNIH